jgi:hypothetical protein
MGSRDDDAVQGPTSIRRLDGGVDPARARIIKRVPAGKIAAVTVVVVVWVAAREIFWVGYAGSDDMYYARYAYLMHRAPLNQFEFRFLTVWLLRASFLALGPSELAACLPGLIASATTFGAVAWFVGWPATLNRATQGSVLLASLLPIDVCLVVSSPGATAVASGFLALGTAFLLKGSRAVSLGGAALLALSFMAHEFSVYYASLVLFTLVLVSRGRYRWHLALFVALCATYLVSECTFFAARFHRPLMRFESDANAMGVAHFGMRSPWYFYTMPLKMLLFSKDFGTDLAVLFVLGSLSWKRLDFPQRVLFLSTAAYCVWMACGTMVPWEYTPPPRNARLYYPLILPICVLTPNLIRSVCARRGVVLAGIALLLAVHVACLAAGGRWGQTVDVSRELLVYASSHPECGFLTDYQTLNEMYVLNGFRLPENVSCPNGPELADLLINKEPSGPLYQFPQRPVSAVLLNRERERVLLSRRHFGGTIERDLDFFSSQRGRVLWRIPPRYKILVHILGPQALGGIAIRNLGGEVIEPPTTGLNPPSPRADAYETSNERMSLRKGRS